MSNREKNIAFMLLVSLIVLLSFFIPIIAFKIGDQKIFKTEYIREQVKSKLDSQIEDIYLLKAIHKFYDYNSNYSIEREDQIISGENGKYHDSQTIINIILEELKNMVIYNVIDVSIIDKIENTKTILTMQKLYNKENYHYQEITLYDYNNEKGIKDTILVVILDMKTNRILKITMYEQNIKENLNKQEIMENYIKYLGLEVITDWSSIKGKLESEKAQLIINNEIKEKEKFSLEVLPMEYPALLLDTN